MIINENSTEYNLTNLINNTQNTDLLNFNNDTETLSS